MTSDLPNKVLVIDLDETIIKTVEQFVEKKSIATIGATTWDKAMYLFNTQKFVVFVAICNLQFWVQIFLLRMNFLLTNQPFLSPHLM